MNICVIGTGYVGLVAGTCFADSGNDVVCVDIDAEKIGRLNKGEIPIYEPGLEELVKRNVKEGRLKFTTDLSYAVKNSIICFIAVGTPSGEDGSADIKYVLEASREIGKAMDGYRVIVDKSTVPVGTADKVRAAIKEEITKPDEIITRSASKTSCPLFSIYLLFSCWFILFLLLNAGSQWACRNKNFIID